jgi:L-asparaginase II
MITPSVDLLRGAIVESRHRVHAAVCDADGALVAYAGDPGLVTFWRSAAKFFQAIPVIADGAAEALGLIDPELGIACSSHNGEARHRELAASLLAKAGCGPDDLACGPHTSLSEPVARAMAERGERPTRLHSNCSGKHAAMLAQARFRGWHKQDYADLGHPVQHRCLEEVARWSGEPVQAIGTGIDGCGVLCFALPVRAMALAYARLGARRLGGEGSEAREAAADRLVRAVTAEPFLIAGTALALGMCLAYRQPANGKSGCHLGQDGGGSRL